MILGQNVDKQNNRKWGLIFLFTDGGTLKVRQKYATNGFDGSISTHSSSAL